MTLQRKFAVLLAALVLAVLANVGAALWAFSVLDSSVSEWAQIQQVQDGLSDIKRAAAEQARLWAMPSSGAAPAEAGREVFNEAAERIERAMRKVEGVDEYRVRIGASTANNLRQRLARAQAAGQDWLARAPGGGGGAPAAICRPH